MTSLVTQAPIVRLPRPTSKRCGSIGTPSAAFRAQNVCGLIWLDGLLSILPKGHRVAERRNIDGAVEITSIDRL
jgi:hypothetical protein